MEVREKQKWKNQRPNPNQYNIHRYHWLWYLSVFGPFIYHTTKSLLCFRTFRTLSNCTSPERLQILIEKKKKCYTGLSPTNGTNVLHLLNYSKSQLLNLWPFNPRFLPVWPHDMFTSISNRSQMLSSAIVWNKTQCHKAFPPHQILV